MGILFSRFRKKVSTKEKLEEIEQELEDIEDFRFSTQQLQRRWVGRLIIFSVIVYLFGALLFFLYFLPSELSKQLLYSLPLLIFPLIVYALKWALHWYYAYKLSQNTDQMVLLQRKKKKLLKEVMTTETYVVAKEILEKYDPDQIRQKAGIIPFSMSNLTSTVGANLPDVGVRRRSAPTRVLPTQPIRPLTPLPRASTLIRPGYNAPPGTSAQQQTYPRSVGVRPQGVPMPCPILPRQRGKIDRLVEYVVGDGPNNRYALICRQCQSHNGMALREEFEYIGFRCCYCYSLNPARKQRPSAPRLSLLAATPAATGGASGDQATLDEGSISAEGPAGEINDSVEGQEAKDNPAVDVVDDSATDKLTPLSSSLLGDQVIDEEPHEMNDGRGDFTTELDETTRTILEDSLKESLEPMEVELAPNVDGNVTEKNDDVKANEEDDDVQTPKKVVAAHAHDDDDVNDLEIIMEMSQEQLVGEGELTSQSKQEMGFLSDE